jgi:hypothetical protein
VSVGYDPDQDAAFELLGLLAEELVAGDVPAAALPGDDEIPAQLVVALQDPEVSIQVCFLPGLDGPPVLQYLVALEHDLAVEAFETTARFLQMVNSTLPLTGFEMSESAQAVVFRYVQAVSVQPLDPGVVAWPLSMIFNAVSRFEPLVAAACAGAPMVDLVSGFGRAMAELYED